MARTAPPRPHHAPLLPFALVDRLLSLAMAKGADFAEVYVERNELTAVSLDEGKVKSAQNGLSQGVGVRVISGARVGYAYSDDLDDEALARAATTASFIAHGGGSEQSFNVARAPIPTFYRVPVPLAQVEIARKRDLVVQANVAARRYDPRVKQVMATYADSTKRIMVANTRGHLAEDAQDLCRLSTMVVVEGKGGERRIGSFGGGGRVPFSHFDTFTPEQVAQEAARQALAAWARRRRRRGSRRWYWLPGGAAFCSTRPSGMGSRPTSFERAPRSSRGSSERRWPASSSPSSTTGPWPTPAVR